MIRDLKLTARSLFRRPAFTLVVVTTLALGLGAQTTLLSVADAVLLRPLPYPDADRLASLYETVERQGVEERRTFSYPDFVAVRSGAPALEAMAAVSNNSFVVGGGESAAARVRGAWVSPAFFEVFGSTPQVGRVFAAERAQDLERAAPPEVVLSHGLWQSYFGGDPGALGAQLELDGDLFTVIGVMPEGFGDDSRTDVWLPILHFGPETFNNRHSRSYGVVAKLRDDASFESAQQQVDAVFAALEVEFPESNIGYGGQVLSLRHDTVGDLRQPVLMLGAAVAMLLLLAVFNVANMLLVESLRRRRPAAIRLALGASPWHLFRQKLLEIALLALAGAGLGLLLAAWGLPVLDRLSPIRLPEWAALGVNLRVVLLTLGGVVGVGASLAAVTAWLDAGPSLQAARHGDRTVPGGGHPMRRALLGAQIALAFIVAAGALVLTASWREWSAIHPGFDAQQLVFFNATLPPAEDLELLSRADELLASLKGVPGVDGATLASDVPLTGGYSAMVVAAEGAVPQPDDAYGGGHRSYSHVVSSDYFATLGIPIVRGRGFRVGEPLEGPGFTVISRRLAERLWPHEDALGKRLRFGPPTTEVEADTLWVEVVGLVDEVRHRTLRPDPERMAEDPDLYVPLDQFPTRNISGAVRVSGSLDERLLALRDAVEPHAASTPFFAWRTIDDHLETQLRTSRFSSLMMAVFAGLALILAAVGVYGLFSHRVGERTREIGVRMALGADRRHVLAWLASDVAATVAAGLALGWIGAGALAVLFEHQLGEALYRVSAGDPRFLAAVAALVAAAAAAASLLPARQATRVDPQVVLRQE
ncbi:MAG: ADOP family duplicated permease [Acidobacteriota bacterium]